MKLDLSKFSQSKQELKLDQEDQEATSM